MHADTIRAEIQALTEAAMCGEVLYPSEVKTSVLRAMGRNELQARDVPGAMEMIALLQHFAPRLSVLDKSVPGLGDDGQDVALAPSLLWGGSKLLLLIEVPAGEFESIAYWVADTLPSHKLKAMPGILALPFTIAAAGEGEQATPTLIPDWFAVFYPHGKPEHAFVTLVLRSMLSNDAVGGDWVDVAVARMGFFGLPRQNAENFVNKGTQPL